MAAPPSLRQFSRQRSVARKLALQALYRWQINECPWQDLVQEFAGAEDMPRADRERQMLAVAERVFAERGFRSASMDEIAELVGVTKPMLYAYFGSKDGLVHISELAPERVGKVTDVVQVGDTVKVKLIGIDDRGKVKLSMRAVDQVTGEELKPEAVRS